MIRQACIKAILIGLILQGSVQAETSVTKTLDYDACRVLVQQGEILSMAELMELVKSLSDGKIIDTQLLQKGTDYIYEMEIAGADGMVKMLYVDARNGEISPLSDQPEQLSQSME